MVLWAIPHGILLEFLIVPVLVAQELVLIYISVVLQKAIIPMPLQASTIPTVLKILLYMAHLIPILT
ncbi:MAG: hypothetical protein EB124_12785 [Betaproteobacteria bacterium]|nr:hypothetical protein [Betaproteobacteria bacterium]